MRKLLWCCAVVYAGALAAADPPPTKDEPRPYSEVIEVTASRVEQPLLDAPVAVTVVDRQQIETSSATNYADLFRGVPGLNVAQTSASDYTVRSRGATRLSDNAQLVLVDGRSIYLDYYGYVIWDFIPISFDELEAVDVVRGPGSSVWGANAISGVINLRTRSPRDLAGGLVTASIGEQGTYSSSLRWAGAAGPWSYKASAAYLRQDAWPRDNRLPSGAPFPFGYAYKNQGTRRPKLDLRLDRDFGTTATLSLRGGTAGSQGVFHTVLGPNAVQRGTRMDYLDTSYVRGALSLRASWNHLDGDAVNMLSGRRDSYENHTTTIEAGNRTLAGKHMLVYGASVHDNQFDLSVAPHDNRRRDWGVYLEDVFEVTHWLEVNAGARADRFDTLGTVVSPRLSIIVKPAQNHAFRIAANRAYRAPTLLENFIDIGVANAVVIGGAPFFFTTYTVGNRRLDEESVDAYEAGWSWQHGPLFLNVSAYRHTIHDIVKFLPAAFYGPSNPPPNWPGPPSSVPPFALLETLTFTNLGEVRMQGLEIAANRTFRRGLNLRASYTYQRDPETATKIAALPVIANNPPRHMASLGGDWSGARWFGSAGISYTDSAYWREFFDSRLWGATDAYTLVDGAVGFSVTPRTQLVLAATNLLDNEVKQHPFGDTIGRHASIEVRQRF